MITIRCLGCGDMFPLPLAPGALQGADCAWHKDQTLVDSRRLDDMFDWAAEEEAEAHEALNDQG